MNSDQVTRIDRLETTQDAYIHKLDQLRTENSLAHAAMQTDLVTIKEHLQLIVEMYRTQQVQLAIIESRLISIDTKLSGNEDK